VSAPLAGTVLTLPGVVAAELLAEPFDLVWIDVEHGALGPHDAQELILGAQAAGTRAFARIPADAHALLAVLLDAGADGIVLADVRDAATVAAAASRLAHPPAGTRGFGPRRVALRGRTAGRPAVRPALWAQVESAAGVAAAAALAAHADALVVGAADLSFALGVPLDLSAPVLLDAVAAVRSACARAGVPFGLAGPLDTAPPELLAGASLLVHATDARLCAAAVDGAAAWLRTTGEAT